MDSRRKLEPKIVLIGVQARTNSTRLPGKCNLMLGDRTVLERVARSCELAALSINRSFSIFMASVRTVILVPYGDDIIERYGRSHLVMDYARLPESDVLSRYARAADSHKADYIVRVTADCAFIPNYMIAKAIKTAVTGRFDYVSNTKIRTYREGYDVEVLSRELLDWLDASADGQDREHVTTLLDDRNLVPGEFRFCHLFNGEDDSDMKTSIDTQEDYERAQKEVASLGAKRAEARQLGDAIA